MKKSNPKKYILSVLLMCLCLANLACVPCKALALDEVKQGIYVDVFIGYYPTGEIPIIKNVHLYISNVTELPVNTGLPAFNDGFISAKTEFVTGGKQSFLSTSVFYNLSQIANETANQYADVVANEFLKVLDYTWLGSICRSQRVDNTTNTVKIFRQFGYLQESMDEIRNFMSYRPTGGFGKFIDNLLPAYVPGTGTTGIVDLYYNVKKVGSTFSWEFMIGGSSSKIIPETTVETEETINLNEMLNNHLPIQASTSQSEIVIDVWKTAETDRSVYNLSITDIQPTGYTIVDDPTNLIRKYENLTTPLNNVIFKVDVRKTDKPSNDNFTLQTIAATAIVITALATVTVIYARKRKIKNQSEKNRTLIFETDLVA